MPTPASLALPVLLFEAISVRFARASSRSPTASNASNTPLAAGKLIEALAKPRGPGHAAQPERLGEERMAAIRVVDGLEVALGLTQQPPGNS